MWDYEVETPWLHEQRQKNTKIKAKRTFDAVSFIRSLLSYTMQSCVARPWVSKLQSGATLPAFVNELALEAQDSQGRQPLDTGKEVLSWSLQKETALWHLALSDPF